MLRAYAFENSAPDSVLNRLNDALSECTHSEVFVTLVYGVLDTRARTWHYANAGHEPPILLRGETLTSLPHGGVALGAVDSSAAHFEDRELELGEKDSLFIFTDGIIEARDERGQMFGAERLAAVLRDAAGTAAVPAVLQAVKDFAGRAPQHDDLTLLCLAGQPAGATETAHANAAHP